MKTPTLEMILSTDGFVADPGLVTIAERKTEKLHRHAWPRMGLVRVHIKRETPRSAPAGFAVRITARRAGAECAVHGSATEPQPAIDAAFRRLERLISDVSGDRKSHRRHPHAVELPAVFPKA